MPSNITILEGDNIDVLPTLASESIDAVITDPPYNLGFMGKGWDKETIAFYPEFWEEVMRVMKPGAHLLAFGHSRTFHRLTCAVEDAGFELRDTIMWLYGTGFPKSLDVSKAIDKAAGAEREVIGTQTLGGTARIKGGGNKGKGYDNAILQNSIDITAPATDEAKQWDGWGTGLKPAFEPIVVARKQLSERTVAANVLQHGTGAINIAACRIGTTVETWPKSRSYAAGQLQPGGHGETQLTGNTPEGRWPANVVHDGSAEVEEAFAQFSSSENAARFFYSAKASEEDRFDSKHPTVKPTSLMQWLCKLVTPIGGTILDCFAGTGSTLLAAKSLNFNAVGIEKEREYVLDIQNKLKQRGFFV